MGLTVNRQMAKNLTVNRQKRNTFTVNRQMRKPILAVKCLRYPQSRTKRFLIQVHHLVEQAIDTSRGNEGDAITLIRHIAEDQKPHFSFLAHKL